MGRGKESPKFLDDLFVRHEDYVGFRFCMDQGPHRATVRNLIEASLGVFEDPKRPDKTGHRIYLVDKDNYRPWRGHGQDVFDYHYILDCVEANDLLINLADYRVNPRSHFTADHDPFDVMMGVKKWSDLEAAPQSEGEICSDFEDDNNPHHRTKTSHSNGRNPYTVQDQKAIIQYIVKKQRYNDVKGRELWERMEKVDVCGRTWQSMKEHFRKQIKDQIGAVKFGLSAEEVKNFNDGWNGDYIYTVPERPTRSTSSVATSTPNESRSNVDRSNVPELNNSPILNRRDEDEDVEAAEISLNRDSPSEDAELPSRPRTRSRDAVDDANNDLEEEPVRAVQNLPTRKSPRWSNSGKDLTEARSRMKRMVVKVTRIEDEKKSPDPTATPKSRGKKRKHRLYTKTPGPPKLLDMLSDSATENEARQQKSPPKKKSSANRNSPHRSPLKDGSLHLSSDSEESEEECDGSIILVRKRTENNEEAIMAIPDNTEKPGPSGLNKNKNKSKENNEEATMAVPDNTVKPGPSGLNKNKSKSKENSEEATIAIPDNTVKPGPSCLNKNKNKNKNTPASQHISEADTESSGDEFKGRVEPSRRPKNKKASKFVAPDEPLPKAAYRALYSYEEDRLIENFIRERGLIRQVTGNRVFKLMEQMNVVPGRTWQSIKNRFHKEIERKFRNKRNVLPHSSSSDEQPTLLSVELDRDRRLYTKEEDQAILDYIVETRRFSEVKGNALWELMEQRDVLPNRTGQSMKERFRKRILPKLSRYNLTQKDRAAFLKV